MALRDIPAPLRIICAMNKFGPSRGELKFRLCMGLLICGLLVAAVFEKGVPKGLVGVELFVFAGAFGVGSVVWSLWSLWKLGKQ